MCAQAGSSHPGIILPRFLAGLVGCSWGPARCLERLPAGGSPLQGVFGAHHAGRAQHGEMVPYRSCAVPGLCPVWFQQNWGTEVETASRSEDRRFAPVDCFCHSLPGERDLGCWEDAEQKPARSELQGLKLMTAARVNAETPRDGTCTGVLG